MKNLLLNTVGANLMIWETNPRKRKTNNTIKFVVKNNQGVEEGDLLVGHYSPEAISSYQIIEIKEIRPAVLKKKRLHNSRC